MTTPTPNDSTTPDPVVMLSLDAEARKQVVTQHDLDSLFSRIEASLDASADDNRNQDRPSRRRSLYLLTRISAAAVVLILMGVFWATPKTVTAPSGNMVSTSLPDGSQVQLNAESAVTFRRAPFFNRRVQLEGEGFFSVVPGEDTFTVQSDGIEVTVLGTRFNIRSRETSSGRSSRVSVEEGRVAVSTSSANEPIVLSAGTSVEKLPNGDVEYHESSDLEAELAWLQGDLVFRFSRFDDALLEASRRLGIPIRLNPESVNASELAQRRINVTFPAPLDAEQVLQGLSFPLGLSIRYSADGIDLVASDSASHTM